jgi:toxin CcdB
MAQFDVYQIADGTLVLDLRSTELDYVNTRVVAPLLPRTNYAKPIPRANPELEVGGEIHILLAHFLSAVPVSALRRRVTNLEHEQYTIKAALDMLFYGF